MTKEKRLIFGLGSGRCGSASLAYLLSQQESTLATHELHPILPWEPSSELLTFRWTQMDHQAHLYDTVFDAGIYYFGYVNSLIKSWQLHEYANKRYDLKFVCLKRNKDEVVKSFLNKFKRQNNNPLQDHNDPTLIKNEWDAAFPKYDTSLSLEEAIGRFYDDYYEIARDKQEEFPEHFKIFATDSLNTSDGVASILSFIGYQNPKIVTGIQKRKH